MGGTHLFFVRVWYAMVSVELQFAFYIVGFVWWEWTNAGFYVWRSDVRVPGRLPNNWFGPIWFLLKAFVSASWILYVVDDFRGKLATVDSGVVTAAWVLLVVHELFRKLWTLVAADLNKRGGALFVALVLVLSGAGVLTLFAISLNGANQATGITGLVLYAVYEAWLVVAFYYNAYYVYLGQDMVRITRFNWYYYDRPTLRRRGVPQKRAYSYFPETL